jgi:glycosyltransferase 2 family protein
VTSPRPPSSPLLPAWLRYGVSLALLGWVAAQVPWSELPGLAALDLRFAAAAVLTAGLAYPLQAWRWQRLLAAQGVPVRPARVHVLFWIGNFYNSFLPGGVAGDGVRLAALWRDHPGHAAGAVARVAADRLIGLAALLALAVLALGAQLATGGGAGELELLLYASATALVVVAGVALAAAHGTGWERPLGRWLGADRTAALRQAVATLAADHGTLLAATGLSVAVWMLDFAALWLLAQAVGLTAGVLPLVVAAAAAYVAASLPVSIGGHGVREGTLVVVLGWLGVGAAAPVLLLTFAFWCLNAGWSAAGALALLAPRGGSGS